jgi:two-component system, OmpR family, response regulator
MREMVLRQGSGRYEATLADAGGSRGRVLRERILFVSDDEQLRALLCRLLLADGYASVLGLDSVTAHTSSSRLSNCDVAIVDFSGSYADAVRAFHRIKMIGNAVTVVIAARSSGSANADFPTNVDVLLSRPFDPRELVFIIRAMLNGRSRGTPPPGREPLSVGPITLHTLLNTATVAAREIDLTGAETRVLEELLVSANNPVTRDRLMRRALGREWIPLDRCLDTHINRLRRKIGDDRQGRTPIRTLRGIGYLLVAEWEPRT